MIHHHRGYALLVGDVIFTAKSSIVDNNPPSTNPLPEMDTSDSDPPNERIPSTEHVLVRSFSLPEDLMSAGPVQESCRPTSCGSVTFSLPIADVSDSNLESSAVVSFTFFFCVYGVSYKYLVVVQADIIGFPSRDPRRLRKLCTNEMVSRVDFSPSDLVWI